MSSESLEKKITDWLFEEGLTVSKIQDDKSEFHLRLPNLYGLQLSMDTVRPMKSPFIVVGVKIQISPQHKQTFTTFSEKEKSDFIFKMQKTLLQLGVEFGFIPNVQNHEFIELHSPIYIEDITRTSFMSAIRSVRNSSLYIQWYYQNKFTGEIGPSSTPSAYG